MTKVAHTAQLIMLKLDAKFHIIPMDDFQVLADENLWDVRMYPRGTSNDAPKQIIVYYRLTIDCCFKISA